jgi:6-phosphogluconolactonase
VSLPEMVPEVKILENAPAVAQAAADIFRQGAAVAIAERGRFNVALSGGSTPRLLFRELAKGLAEGLTWEHIHLFWGDERTVPPNHQESNFRLVKEELLSRVTIPSTNIHRLHGENPDPATAASDYEAELRRFFDLQPDQLPRFDLVFLGLGNDGHTASLFSGSEALTETEHLVAAPWVAQLKTRRLTLTVPVFNHAASVVFLVCGQDKSKALHRVLEGPRHPLELPSQLIEPNGGELMWLVDTEAARFLSR